MKKKTKSETIQSRARSNVERSTDVVPAITANLL